jgi:hypothetical protein
MSARGLGFVVARGLAMVFFAISVNAGINSIAILIQAVGPPWRYVAPHLITSAVYFSFAGILWRGAKLFGSGRVSEENGPPVDAEAALRIAMLAIAFYIAFAHLPPVVNCLFAAADPERRNEIRAWSPSLGFTMGDVVTFILAVIAIPVLYKGPPWGRTFAYPRLEPDED